MDRRALCGMLGILILVVRMSAFNPATHLWLGDQTLDIWENYDPQFAFDVVANDDNETRRMYRIGLMLPDLLSSESQSAIRDLVTNIHDHLQFDNTYSFDFRHWGMGIAGEISVFLNAWSALWIDSSVYSNVQIPIEFNGPPPNRNLDKLWQMVEHIHNTNAPSSHKALIYGAFMHVLQDQFAHMILQPSLFGYPYVLESDTAFMKLGLDSSFQELPDSLIGPLFFFESYYEAFVPTFINSQSLQMIFMKLFPQNFTFDVDTSYGQILTWQYIYHPAVDSFVQVAHEVGYGTPSSTYERLHAYLHGAGILTFWPTLRMAGSPMGSM